MLLHPKRTKFRKLQKSRISGTFSNKTKLMYGYLGLRSLNPGKLTSKQIEASRRAMTRKSQRKGRIWIRVFPDQSITKKPSEIRMGKGKGSHHSWYTPIKKGQIIFELALPIDSKGNWNKLLSREVLKFGVGKLPFRTSFTEL